MLVPQNLDSASTWCCGVHKNECNDGQKDRLCLSASDFGQWKRRQTCDSGRRVRQKDNLLPSQKSVTQQAQARQEKKVDHFVTVPRKVAALKDNNCDCWHHPFCVVHKEEYSRSSTHRPWVPKDHALVSPRHRGRLHLKCAPPVASHTTT